jgi:hypothetical protein
VSPQSLVGLSCSSENSFGGLTNQWLGLVSFLGYVDDKMCFSDVAYFLVFVRGKYIQFGKACSYAIILWRYNYSLALCGNKWF